MWLFILMFLVLAIYLLRVWTRNYGHDEFLGMRIHDVADKVVFSFIGTIVWVIITFLACPFAVRVTTGMMPDYSKGQRMGYVTKISNKGFCWKTWEAEMQIGTGDLAALQKPFEFSITDPTVLKQVQDLVELKKPKRVTIEYEEKSGS